MTICSECGKPWINVESDQLKEGQIMIWHICNKGSDWSKND